MRWRQWLLVLTLLAGVVGCRTIDPPFAAPDIRVRLLQDQPAVHSVEVWDANLTDPDMHTDGLIIRTRHYRIATTVQDGLLLKRLPVFLESCWQIYRELIEPGELPPVEPLPVFLFDTRGQWEAFTRDWAGTRAPEYLRIEAGAYYLNGACVAYRIGRQMSYSVLAHEGWHQFSDRYFQYYLPAWLDEGLATFFEAHVWRAGRVRFVPAQNGWRIEPLRQALERNAFYPLEALLILDAGQALGGTEAGGASAFYAQVYALTRFLREYDHGKYYPGWRRMINDAYAGRWPLPDLEGAESRRTGKPPARAWNRRVGPWLITSYISDDIQSLQQEFLLFCRYLTATLPEGTVRRRSGANGIQ